MTDRPVLHRKPRILSRCVSSTAPAPHRGCRLSTSTAPAWESVDCTGVAPSNMALRGGRYCDRRGRRRPFARPERLAARVVGPRPDCACALRRRRDEAGFRQRQRERRRVEPVEPSRSSQRRGQRPRRRAARSAAPRARLGARLRRVDRRGVPLEKRTLLGASLGERGA